jgi:outer membrane protein assembly factor BamB
MIRCNAAVLGLAVWLAAVPARAGDWPAFRGPTGDGHAPDGTTLPDTWGPAVNVSWKADIAGKGWSSPVVSGTKVFLTTAVPSEKADSKELSQRAVCLDAKSGKMLWDVEVFHQDGTKPMPSHGKNSHASPTPVTDGRKLWVHFGPQGTACLDLDGKVLWRNTELGYSPVHGNGGSPVLVGDKLVYSADGGDKQFVVALNKDSGKVVWKTDRKGDALKKFSFSTPMPVEVNGKTQIVSPASDLAQAFDPDTGKEIWRIRYKGYSVIPKPLFGHGLVFILTGYESPQLYAVRPDGTGDVTETHVAWHETKGMSHTPSAILAGDELYTVADNGVATCFDAKTGTTHWRQRLPGNYSASPIYADGKLYFQNETGTGTVVRASKKFEILGKNTLDEPTLASYAAADGALFVRTEKHLYRFENKAPGTR